MTSQAVDRKRRFATLLTFPVSKLRRSAILPIKPRSTPHHFFLDLAFLAFFGVCPSADRAIALICSIVGMMRSARISEASCATVKGASFDFLAFTAAGLVTAFAGLGATVLAAGLAAGLAFAFTAPSAAGIDKAFGAFGAAGFVGVFVGALPADVFAVFAVLVGALAIMLPLCGTCFILFEY